MALDPARYLALFVNEATDHLEALATDMVRLEAGDNSVIDSMFRHAHSVKGMSASMGFEATATLAHRMEDLLDAIREKPERKDAALVDLLLAASDALMDHVKDAGAHRAFTDHREMLSRVTRKFVELTGRAPAPTRVVSLFGSPVDPRATPGPPITRPKTPPPAPSAPQPAAQEAATPTAGSGAAQATTEAPAETPAPSPAGATPAAGEPAPAPRASAPRPSAPRNVAPGASVPRYSIRIRVSLQSATPGVRGFLIVKRLSTLGNVFDLKPPLEDLKAGRLVANTFSFELETTQSEETVRQTIDSLTECELLALARISADSASTAATPPAPQGPESARVVGVEPNRTVRVKTELLDSFLEVAGELLSSSARLREVNKTLPAAHQTAMGESIDQLHALVKRLHDNVMKARMTPVAVVTDRLPRAARDIARRREREVDLVITGADVELDRALLDELAEPLLHLLRNSIDHGIEAKEDRERAQKPPRGRIDVIVHREKDKVLIELRDDGRGFNVEKLRAAAVSKGQLTLEEANRLSDKETFMLACLPGVSTAGDVDDISGRGVGMDAVKRVIEGLGGTLEIDSQAGVGTTFRLKLPLTVAVMTLLLVKSGGEVFGLPIAKVAGVIEATEAAIVHNRTSTLLTVGESVVPLYQLSDVLELNRPTTDKPTWGSCILVDGESGRMAFSVDRLLGQEEVVLKPLAHPLDLIPGLSGVTILGSGRPVFILDVPRLVAA